MNPTQNLENQNLKKRIKRHVIAKSHRFFAATLPGLEPLCLDELERAGISPTDAAVTTGGIEFTGRLHHAYLANLNLRTANRVLMRLCTFTAANFRQLEKKLDQVPWELFVKPEAACMLNITSKKSRLIHTEAIGERFKSSMARKTVKTQDTAAGNHAPAGPAQQIFVRVQDDRFTVSMDSSGELLHKRGVKTHGGSAPVRETMAAAILMLAGYNPAAPLIDPMCGSGTFSLEAAMMAANIPAGWFRDFTFMDWPAFRPEKWRHIRRAAEKTILPAKSPVIFASDIDGAAVQKLSETVHSRHLSTAVRVREMDFFALMSRDIEKVSDGSENTGLIVLNPPYGRRLGSRNAAETSVGPICKKLNSDFKGWNVALLLPDQSLLSKIPFPVTTRQLSHGGLKITLATGFIF